MCKKIERSFVRATLISQANIMVRSICCFFFFQAEDGIRDYKVTGVQTCALPIYLGMPRRYFQYPGEFQVLNVLSTAGATVLGVGYLLPMIYFLWSMRYGKPAPDNPWNAAGLEWKTASPPTTFNFQVEPVVTWEAYNYDEIDAGAKQEVQVVG